MKLVIRGQESGDNQGSGVRSQESGVRSQESVNDVLRYDALLYNLAAFFSIQFITNLIVVKLVT